MPDTQRSLPRILATIRATKEAEVAALLARTPLAALEATAAKAGKPRDFLAALRNTGFAAGRVPVRLIAEIKKASPSKGVIRADFNPPALAQAYEAGGADAISCLTDREYFQGTLEYLVAVKAAAKLPVLRKDFLIHPAQVMEARASGADAVLLIARMLDAPRYAELHALARSLGMTVLCEIHDVPDLDKTLAIDGVQLVGINSRDLDTFVVNTEAAWALRERIPAHLTAVAESGIFTSEDMRGLAARGFAAALVGESLMRQEDVAAATRTLLAQ